MAGRLRMDVSEVAQVMAHDKQMVELFVYNFIFLNGFV